MSELTSIEKMKLEKFLEMGGGYVLDFSNNTFQEFVQENSNIDIYDEKYNYRSGSKANRLRALWTNRLRALWNNESNTIAGGLLSNLLEYWKANRLINNQSISLAEQQLFEECNIISRRLMSGSDTQNDGSFPDSAQPSFLKSELLTQFDRFADLSSPQDRRSRGLLLEGLLQHIFDLYGIPVEKGFRRNEGGEQLDGAFKLEGWYYLVECKWTQKLTDIRQLDSLYGKINRSGRQTLGLFLSINGWSKNVCPLLRQNQDKSIILMDGYDLRCVLNDHIDVSLKDLLLAKLAHLNFEGQPFYSVAEYLDKNG